MLQLQNGRFDTFRSWKDIGEIWLAEGWEPFWAEHDPAHPSYNRRPEFKRSGDEATGPRRAPEGFQYAQQWFNWSGHHRAGIYQRVTAPVGRNVRFSVQAMAWYSTRNDPSQSERSADDPGYKVQVGIDPTGGTDAFAASALWGVPEYPHDGWHTIWAETKAQTTVITVFVRGEPTWPVVNVNCYVGDARLVVVDNAPLTDAALGDMMQSRVIPLNPDAALLKAAVARGIGLLPASDEKIIGDQVVQVFRTDQDRGKQYVAACRIGDWGNVRWWTRAN